MKKPMPMQAAKGLGMAASKAPAGAKVPAFKKGGKVPPFIAAMKAKAEAKAKAKAKGKK
jgi:hypothetical protein